MEIIGIIPSRYSSTRLPGKPLLDICGKTLLQRVWENAEQSTLLNKVLIATDDARISAHSKEIGAECVMTAPELNSGTDRIASAYNINQEKGDIILNIQGDEPLLQAFDIDNLIRDFIDSGKDTGTLIKRIDKYEDLLNPNVVKAVISNNNEALYFSRSPIPFIRDVNQKDWLKSFVFYRHIGIYIYKKEALFKFVNLQQSSLELAEKLEQLRLLQNGISMHCVETDLELLGVDTEHDLEQARLYFSQINE